MLPPPPPPPPPDPPREWPLDRLTPPMAATCGDSLRSAVTGGKEEAVDACRRPFLRLSPKIFTDFLAKSYLQRQHLHMIKMGRPVSDQVNTDSLLADEKMFREESLIFDEGSIYG